MRFPWLLLVLGLGGCAEFEMAEDAGPSPSEAHEPATCTLDSVQVVDDLSVVPQGFASAPADWMDQMSGTFAGEVFTPYGSLAGEMQVERAAGLIRVIRYTWSDTDAPCGAHFEIGFGASIAAGYDELDEIFSATLQVDAENRANFALDISVNQLRGTLRPEHDEGDGTKLGIAGDFHDAIWSGDLGWRSEVDGYEAWEDIGAFNFVITDVD